MDKKALQARMQAVSDRFNELQKQGEDIQLELTKLQGEYRAYDALLKESDPAKTVKAPDGK